MSVVDEVKQRLDIVEVVQRYVPLQKSGRNFRANCPFHNEKTPSFFVFPERQTWHCFGACSTGGDAITFVMKKEGMTFGEALRFLADRVGVLMPTRIEAGPGRDEKERLYQANEVAAGFYNNQLVTSPQSASVRAYLQKRGLDADSISRFQLGHSPDAWEKIKQYLAERGFTEAEMINSGLVIRSDDGRTHDRFRNRLMFPIHDERGRVTGFGGRALEDNQQPKYLNSPQSAVFDKSNTLYGIHLSLKAIREADLAIITEGYMDVIVPHQYGFKNVVASMGVAITDRQVTKLKRLTKNLVLALDPDEAGEEAMLRCIDYNNMLGAEVRVAIVPGGKDPDELVREDPEAWKRLVDAAKPVIEFAIEKTVAKLDMSRANDKSTAASALLPVFARVRDDIRRDHYLTRLSKLTKIGYNQLEAVLKTHMVKPGMTGGRVAKPASLKSVTTAAATRENYALSLILHHPELKSLNENLLPEYFQDTENREIYVAWLGAEDMVALREKLDPVVVEKLEQLESKPVPEGPITDRFNDCVLLLRRKYLQEQDVMQREVAAMEAEAAGHKAPLQKLIEEGESASRKHEIDVKLSEIRKRARK